MQFRSWINSATQPIKWVACAALLTACTGIAHADWSDNFDAGLQQSWSFGDPDARPGFSAGAVGGELVITNSSTPDGGGSSTGFGVVITESFTDVKMTGIINPSGDGNINDTVGLLIRGNLLNQSFYMAEINYSEGNLHIYRNGGPGNSNIATEAIPSLNFTDSVYVEVEAIGDQIEAWVYDAPGGTLRANTSVTDNSFASGLSGVLVNENFGGLPMLGVWDDLTSVAIGSDVVGDYDGDGDVDADDYADWKASFGSTTDLDADGSSNSIIDAADYTIWRDALAGGEGSATQIPEPAAALLVALAVCLGFTGRRRIS